MSAPLSGSQLPVYTWDDISKHKSAESLWVVIEGKVYDITSFQEEHPGGPEVLLDNAATDATGAFTDVGHSEDAVELRNKYLIGVVGSKSSPGTASTSAADACSRRAARMKEVALKVAPVVLVAGLAIGLGIILYKRFK